MMLLCNKDLSIGVSHTVKCLWSIEPHNNAIACDRYDITTLSGHYSNSINNPSNYLDKQSRTT